MDDKFLVGILLGMVGGAVIATNSYKARQAVKDSQDQIIEKAKDFQKKTKNQNGNQDTE